MKTITSTSTSIYVHLHLLIDNAFASSQYIYTYSALRGHFHRSSPSFSFAGWRVWIIGASNFLTEFVDSVQQSLHLGVILSPFFFPDRNLAAKFTALRKCLLKKKNVSVRKWHFIASIHRHFVKSNTESNSSNLPAVITSKEATLVTLLKITW